MKLLCKFFLTVLLLTVASVSWAVCPEGEFLSFNGCVPCSWDFRNDSYYEKCAPKYTDESENRQKTEKQQKDTEESYPDFDQELTISNRKRLLRSNNCIGCNLIRANLNRKNLDYANLHRANLTGAGLVWASLYRANLREANLTDADLHTARLIGADLSFAILKGAKLSLLLGPITFDGVDLSGHDLSGLGGMGGSSFRQADLSGADLSEGYWGRCDFTNANLSGANLSFANVSEADFTGANLSGVDLTTADLEDADFRNVIIDEQTVFPAPPRKLVEKDPNRTSPITPEAPSKVPTTPESGAESTPEPPPSYNPSLRLVGTGTAFVVNKNYLLTASHVIDACVEVSVQHAHEEVDVAIAASDKSNDLALLKSAETFSHIAKFRSGKSIRLGDTVVNYGFPLRGLLSDSAKISKGEINSLAGIGNDSSVLQYDASTQPGNSGGPVLDLSGNVVGVVSHRYSKESNVNFAVKSYVAIDFLSANGIGYENAESVEEMGTADIAEKAERFTVLVGCWQ